MAKTPSKSKRRIEISGDLDRYSAEELQLEIRRLLKQAGIEFKSIRIVEGGEDSVPS
jgi:hypothetical protein